MRELLIEIAFSVIGVTILFYVFRYIKRKVKLCNRYIDEMFEARAKELNRDDYDIF